MRENRRIWIFLVFTAVFLSGIHTLAQAQQTPTEASGGGTTVYLPAILVNCIAYSDDFSDSNSGWYVGPALLPDGTEIGFSDYINGEYRIMSTFNRLIRPISPAQPFENYSVEADVRNTDSPTDAALGLVFGVVANGNIITDYYAFVIQTNPQKYALIRLERTIQNGDVVFINHPIVNFTDSSAILADNAVNHLVAKRNGTQITLEVNGTTLGTWTDGNISGPTYSGLALNSTSTNLNVDARYDNFVVNICQNSTTKMLTGWQTTGRQLPIVENVDLLNK